MNKAFVLKNEQRDPKWIVIDIKDQILGRVSTRIADILRGRHKAEYTPHTDTGDYVVVINCEKLKLTGKKWSDKIYKRYSGYRGGLKETTAKDAFAKNPAFLVESAVRGMLPKSKMGRAMFKKLRVYVGDKHPHTAQV
ncbi:50S ribosomal protein L13 [Candidatus Dependentiae bacterium]|nr:MAG: 50S ribosomal protein L13 [Candidatus Dependentiae bacterium]